MLTTHLAAIVTAALGAGPSTTPDASMLRYPDIGKTDIVFVFQGNLWLVPKTGGMARPLTSAAGAESMPRFSPDGTEIAVSMKTATDNNQGTSYHFPLKKHLLSELCHAVVAVYPDQARLKKEPPP
jgi:tricorn protease